MFVAVVLAAVSVTELLPTMTLLDTRQVCFRQVFCPFVVVLKKNNRLATIISILVPVYHRPTSDIPCPVSVPLSLSLNSPPRMAFCPGQSSEHCDHCESNNNKNRLLTHRALICLGQVRSQGGNVYFRNFPFYIPTGSGYS